MKGTVIMWMFFYILKKLRIFSSGTLQKSIYFCIVFKIEEGEFSYPSKSPLDFLSSANFYGDCRDH